jgi:hypothetical protein
MPTPTQDPPRPEQLPVEPPRPAHPIAEPRPDRPGPRPSHPIAEPKPGTTPEPKRGGL